VKKILIEGVDPPIQEKARKTDDLTPIIKMLFERVNGNVVRVQEILKADYVK